MSDSNFVFCYKHKPFGIYYSLSRCDRKKDKNRIKTNNKSILTQIAKKQTKNNSKREYDKKPTKENVTDKILSTYDLL